MSEFILRQTTGAKLEAAVERNGGTAADVEWLCTRENFKLVTALHQSGATFATNAQIAATPASTYADDRVRVVSATTIEVNLDAPLNLPFTGATIETASTQKGWVTVERKGDDLYVAGAKVDLFRSPEQQAEKTNQGHKLRKVVPTPRIHPNIMDAIGKHAPQMLSDKYKKDSKDRTLYLYSWDVIFRDSGGRLCVRCWYWRGGALQSSCGWLGSDWGVPHPGLVLASA